MHVADPTTGSLLHIMNCSLRFAMQHQHTRSFDGYPITWRSRSARHAPIVCSCHMMSNSAATPVLATTLRLQHLCRSNCAVTTLQPKHQLVPYFTSVAAPGCTYYVLVATRTVSVPAVWVAVVTARQLSGLLSPHHVCTNTEQPCVHLVELGPHNACACLPAIQQGHVSITQLPTKHSSILSLAFRANTLWQRHKALLHTPAQQHLQQTQR